MAEFTMTIAGATGRVRCLFDSTPLYCAKYQSDAPPEFCITVQPEDLVFEQAQLDREAADEGFKRRQFTDPFLERQAIQRRFADYLLPRQVLLIHGSAIAADGKGYLFLARSGTGKSTHTRLWQQLLGHRAVMINDDKPFLRFRDEDILLCGAPWSGKHGLDANISVPLAGICLLERGLENRIHPLPAADALPMLEKQAWQSPDPAGQALTKTLILRLCRQVPTWHLTCNKDLQAAQVAFAAMSQP